MTVRLRLFPVVIFAAALFLTVRIGGLWTQVDIAVGGTSEAQTATKPVDLTAGMSAANVNVGGQAESEPAKGTVAKSAPTTRTATKSASAKAKAGARPSGKAEAAKADKSPTGTAKVETAEAQEPAADMAQGKAAAGTDSAKPATAGTQAGTTKTASDGVNQTPARPVLPRKPAKDEALPDPEDFSDGDLKVLQELAERRRQLDQRAHNVTMREGLLKAAEKRVEQKIAELAKMKAKLEALVKQHEQQKNVQLASLVKIYENMKPKDAAKVFNQLDMGILVELLAHMKERKSAPIMAAMDPARVKEVTARLISRRAVGPTADAGTNKTLTR